MPKLTQIGIDVDRVTYVFERDYIDDVKHNFLVKSALWKRGDTLIYGIVDANTLEYLIGVEINNESVGTLLNHLTYVIRQKKLKIRHMYTASKPTQMDGGWGISPPFEKTFIIDYDDEGVHDFITIRDAIKKEFRGFES